MTNASDGKMRVKHNKAYKSKEKTIMMKNTLDRKLTMKRSIAAVNSENNNDEKHIR